MSTPTWNQATCSEIEKLFLNAKRRKEEADLQAMLEMCHSEQERLALEELYKEVI